MDVAAPYRASLAEVIDTLDSIHDTFETLHAVQSGIGFDPETGLLGELSETSARVERRLVKEARFGGGADYDKLARAIVEVSRNEKAFLLNPTDVAEGAFEVAYARFDRRLKKAKIPEDVRGELSGDMATYRKAFDAYTGLVAERAKTVELMETLFSLLPPRLDALKAVAEEGRTEAVARLAQVRTYTLAIVTVMIGASIVVATLLGLVIASSITGQLVGFRKVMERLADGENDVDIPGTGGRDEMSAMARTLMVFRNNAVERERLRAEQANEEEARNVRAGRIAGLIGSFEDTVAGVLAGLNSASQDLRGAAKAVEEASDNVTEEARRAGDSVSIATDNVGSAAQATRENGILHRANRGTGGQVPRDFAQGHDGCRGDIRHHGDARSHRRPHRSGDASDPRHRRPDQHAGAQCHHRGGAGRRGRARVRGRCGGGEGAGDADLEGDGGNRDPDRVHPGHFVRCDELDFRHPPDHRRHARHCGDGGGLRR